MDKNKLAVKMFNNRAGLYEKKYMDVSSYAESLDLFCEKLGYKNLSILELACGPGNITKYLLDKCDKYKILGTDLAPAMIDLAKKNCPLATFQILDCREISNLDRDFDAIVSGFCFPYLDQDEVKTLIFDAKESLKPEGLLYISTIHGDYKESGIKKSSTSGDEVYFFYHDRDFIEKNLIKSGFEIIETKVQPDSTQEEVTDIIILAQKK